MGTNLSEIYGLHVNETRSSATAKSTARLSCLVGVGLPGENLLMANQPLLRRPNWPQELYRIRQITRTTQPLHRSRSLKVTHSGTNRKPICDFLLVINTKLPSILHRRPIIGQIFASDRGVPHFNALAIGDPL